MSKTCVRRKTAIKEFKVDGLKTGGLYVYRKRRGEQRISCK
jgi:hypothetical protein